MIGLDIMIKTKTRQDTTNDSDQNVNLKQEHLSKLVKSIDKTHESILSSFQMTPGTFTKGEINEICRLVKLFEGVMKVADRLKSSIKPVDA